MTSTNSKDSNEPLPSLPTAVQWLTLLRLLHRYRVVLLLCLPGALFIATAKPSLMGIDPQIPAQQPSVSRADYERLTIGMTLTDAQASLGKAIEVSRDEMTATYRWINSDGSTITAIFKGNHLTSKQQLNLK